MLSDSESESDDGNHDANLGPFMCELCYRENANTTAIFKEYYHLMVHTRKKHPTTCVGCYEEFESIDEMREHIRSGVHRTLLICHECLTVLPDVNAMTQHDCEVKPQRVEESETLRSALKTKALTERSGDVEGGGGMEWIPLPSVVKSEERDGKEGEETSESGSVCTEIESGESDVEADNESGPFLCEICDVGDGKSSFVFKQRHHLVRHLMKRHPSVCPGCFQQFDDVEEMQEHMRCADHNLPVCCRCWRVFSDGAEKGEHICENEESRNGGDSEEAGSSNVCVKVEAVSESEESDLESDGDSSCADESDNDVKEDDRVSCLYCSSFSSCSQSELRSHTYENHETVCCVCFEECDDKEDLERHQWSMNHYVWFDKRCKRVFIRRTIYQRHVSQYHPQDCPIVCPHCDNFGTFRKDRHREHMLKKHAELQDPKAKPRPTSAVKFDWHISSKVCVLCRADFCTSYSLLLHMYECHKEAGLTHIFKCESCNVGFGRGKFFESHLKKYHADDTEYLEEARVVVEGIYERSNNCNLCGQTFRNRSKIYHHMKRKHPSMRSHKCNICGDGFPQESDLRVHDHMNHNGPPFLVCPLCGLARNAVKQLETHLVRQHGYKMLPVAYCFTHKRSFANDGSFQNHFEFVHLKRPKWNPSDYGSYPCNICGKVFDLENRLKAHHMKVHHSKEKVKCDECGLTFKDAGSLSNHKIKHAAIYKCNVCGKSFECKQFLNRHEVVHSGEKPFACELCGLRVSQKSALQRHVKVVHPDGKVKANARAPSLRGTRGPLTKQRDRGQGVGKQSHSGEDIDNKDKAAEVNKSEVSVSQPKRKRKGGAKRRRESISSDSDEIENGVSERSIGSVEMNEAGRKKPERKKQRVAMRSYRESSSSEDLDVEEDDDGVDLDAPRPKKNSNPRKARKKTPPKKKRGRPPKKK